MPGGTCAEPPPSPVRTWSRIHRYPKILPSGASQAPSTIGVFAEVTVQTIEAPSTASRGLSAMTISADVVGCCRSTILLM